MKPLAGTIVVLSACSLAVTAFCASALALPAPAGTQAGRPVRAATHAPHADTGAPCNVGLPVIGGVVSTVTNGLCEAGSLAGGAVGAVGGLVGEAAGSAANSVLDGVSEWMIAAATQVTGFVAREMTHMTTPQLSSGWFAAQFAPMADLGAALGLLVTLVALACAAVRRSPDALAGTLSGIMRAGLGTGLLVALTTIGLALADEISNAVLTGSPHAFWATVAHSWGAHGFGGFGSSALAMLIALVEVFASLFVWFELIVRGAAIYLAVLFFPVVLAAAIWPALASWPGRLGRLLLLFVILKPVTIIVLTFAGNAAAAGLSLRAGGVSGSVGTILAAIVILGLAAFAPWTLMYLLAVDAESAYTSAGIRASAGSATTGRQGRSVRTMGGLAGTGSQSGAGRATRMAAGGSGGAGLPSGGTGADPSGGGGAGGNPSGGGGTDGNPSGGGGAGGSRPSGPSGGTGGGTGPGGSPSPVGSSPVGEGSGMTGGETDGSLPVGSQNIGAGSIGAAAGMTSGSAGNGTSRVDGRSRSRPATAANGARSAAQSVRLAQATSASDSSSARGQNTSSAPTRGQRAPASKDTSGASSNKRRPERRLRLVHDADADGLSSKEERDR